MIGKSTLIKKGGGTFFFDAIGEIKIYNATSLTDSMNRMRFYHD